MLITPPTEINFGFFNGYIQQAADTDLITALNNSSQKAQLILANLNEEQLLFRYAEGKWNIKEVTTHLIDAERNFCYRTLRISRKDQIPAPPFDVNNFVLNSFATGRDMKAMLHELDFLRQASILMFEGMPPEMLDRTGTVRDITISVRALGFILAGHMRHHIEIVKERYLSMQV